ncbi:ATP-binding cassette domain-containing protein [Epidermidibacterium keratini]|uniref:ATP-binding cassette domain-containing protein n=1 Tax=Epidermidibacterium keratini TaxID=1891644 RepID=A0A7L4YMD6_9ACTN|nr:ATP-binding cassette domain-containing protein [Epidermidibacterium keratini]QHC00248.1 ATP-binding cassette domain-containing protein [Epidermidibacterium keratini]
MSARDRGGLTPSLRLLRGRPAWLLVGAILLAVLGEASAIGLIGLSGWFVVQCAIAGATPGGTFSYVIPSAGVRAFALTRIAGQFAQRLVAHAATLRWLARLRVRLFGTVAATDAGSVRALRSGEALDRAMADVDTLDGLVLSALQPIPAIVLVCAGSVVTVAAFAPSTALVLAVGLILAAAFAIAGNTRVRPTATERGRTRAQLVAAIEAAPELISLGAQHQLLADADARLRKLSELELKRDFRRAGAAALTDVVVALAVTGVLASLVPAIATVGQPVALLVVLIAMGALELAVRLGPAAEAWREARTAAQRLELPAGRPDGTAVIEAAGAEVEFGDLRVPAGGALVVSGRSGSGKTTMLHAIAGISTAAEVRIDGREPSAYAPGQIGYAGPDDVIFTGTVADNLRMGDDELTDDQAVELLHAVALDVRVDEKVGPGGRALSGGEERRLVIARLLAAKPAVLLLDEPTDGLDPATGHTVLLGIHAALPGVTVIAAIHDSAPVQVPWPDMQRLVLGGPQT